MPGKELVLVGGGHAHVQVLHALKDSGLKITLISDVAFAPYSCMLPGCLAGTHQEQELVFDLAQLCQRFGYRFIHEGVASVDGDDRFLTLKDGCKISFDVCSLNVGILPREIEAKRLQSSVIYVKPISTFLEKWKEQFEYLTLESRVVVIGGGAAAFELAIACGLRFPGRVTLVAGEKGLTLPKGALLSARQALADLEINLSEGQRVEAIEEKSLRLSHLAMPFDLALIAITARPSEVVVQSDVLKSGEGHVVVDEYLRVKNASHVFAAGDCVHFGPKGLPKAGVYAVRQGPILARNLLSTLEGKKELKPYVPQKNILALLICGKEEALFCWRGVVLRGRWVWLLKKYIDQRFMRKFS